MNFPFAGLSMCMNLIIIGVGVVVRTVFRFFVPARPFTPHVTRVHSRPRLSFLISFAISIFSFGALLFILIFAAKQDDSNYVLAMDALNACEELPKADVSGNIVILRLDDVQAQTWSEISIAMMKGAIERGMPIVAGVIPYKVNTDASLQRYFKLHGCNTEIALHGYTHMDSQYEGLHEHGATPEFGRLSKHATRKKLDAAFAELRTFSSMNVVTFIPPENQISEAAAAVLKEYGIRYLSKEGKGTYDYHSSTWTFDEDHYVPAKQALRSCKERFSSGERLCVLMLHPQDYAKEDGTLNVARFRDYILLLDELKKMDVGVATFRDLDRDLELKAR